MKQKTKKNINNERPLFGKANEIHTLISGKNDQEKKHINKQYLELSGYDYRYIRD